MGRFHIFPKYENGRKFVILIMEEKRKKIMAEFFLPYIY